MSAVRIRHYQDSDWHGVCAVHDAARAIEVENLMPAGSVQAMHEVAEADGFFEATCLVAETELGISGFICTDSAELSWLYVSPKLHRTGIGTALFNRVRAELAPDLWLNTPAENQGAVQFYQRMGLQLSASFPGHCQGHPCTCLRLVLPGSRMHKYPPMPTREALLLAGFTDQGPGTAKLDANDVWRWTL